MEEFRCLDCNHVGPLNQQGQCSACLSFGVISEEVIKIRDIDYIVENRKEG
jgi:predicted ATP-dependent serine protease